MRLCMFILRVLTKMEKLFGLWIPQKIKVEETFFLYDIESEEMENLYED
jgi:hypothetical protein